MGEEGERGVASSYTATADRSLTSRSTGRNLATDGNRPTFRAMADIQLIDGRSDGRAKSPGALLFDDGGGPWLPAGRRRRREINAFSRGAVPLAVVDHVVVVRLQPPKRSSSSLVVGQPAVDGRPP